MNLTHEQIAAIIDTVLDDARPVSKEVPPKGERVALYLQVQNYSIVASRIKEILSERIN